MSTSILLRERKFHVGARLWEQLGATLAKQLPENFNLGLIGSNLRAEHSQNVVKSVATRGGDEDRLTRPLSAFQKLTMDHMAPGIRNVKFPVDAAEGDVHRQRFLQQIGLGWQPKSHAGFIAPARHQVNSRPANN